MKKTSKQHRHIDYFCPCIEAYNQNYPDLLKTFNAGDDAYSFDYFLTHEAETTSIVGDGTTHLVWNVFYDISGNERKRELVGFYTLIATSIPYIDRIRKEPEEMQDENDLYDDKIYGISAVEVKMFAVDTKYQDLFYEHDGLDLPISAWIIRNIVNYIEQIITNTLGVKAIFLHSVSEAEAFYQKNMFSPLLENMKPLGSIDDDFTPMYMPLRDVQMNYEVI